MKHLAIHDVKAGRLGFKNMRVAGLDLARRSDHSALAVLDVAPDWLTVTAALRLPQAPLRQQFALIAPRVAGLDLLVFDQSGLGDAAAELLPATPPHVGVCLIGSDRPLARSASGDRLVVGKSRLIQRLGAVMRSGALIPTGFIFDLCEPSRAGRLR